MDRFPIAFALVCVLIAGCAAAPALPRLERSAKVFSGMERRIAHWYDISADCLPEGEVTMRTVTPPSHGSVRFELTPWRVGPNALEVPACIGREVEATAIVYRSAPGFEGTDRMSLQTHSPTGGSKLVEYRLEVTKPPQAASRVDPVYPREAQIRGIEGTVTARLRVEPDGAVSDVTIIASPNELLSAATARALSQWRFNPQPGGFVADYQITYQLGDPLPQTPNLR